MTTQQITQLKFNKLTEAQYEATTPVDNEFYITTDANYALDSEAVHKSGNETITGQKTYNIDGYNIYKSTVMDITNEPTEAHSLGINYADKNGNVHGQSFLRTESNGNVVQSIACLNHSQTSWAQFSVGFDSSDNMFAYLNGNLIKGFIKETYNSGTNWYRVWSDGWIEQGGFCYPKTSATVTVTLLKAYSNTNYNITLAAYWSGGHPENVNNSNKTASSFQLTSGSGANFGVFWRCAGY